MIDLSHAQDEEVATKPAAAPHKCAYKSAGRGCKMPTAGRSAIYCKLHTCPTTLCSNAKRSRESTCPSCTEAALAATRAVEAERKAQAKFEKDEQKRLAAESAAAVPVAVKADPVAVAAQAEIDRIKEEEDELLAEAAKIAAMVAAMDDSDDDDDDPA